MSKLRQLTDTQLERLYGSLWSRIATAMGVTSFDYTTAHYGHSGLINALLKVRMEQQHRLNPKGNELMEGFPA